MHSILLLRLEAPMQAWALGPFGRGTYIRTHKFPTKSGVTGIILASMGLSKLQTGSVELARINSLKMGARADRSGVCTIDLQTVQVDPRDTANGTRNAIGGTLVYRREYLSDASFLVAIQGDRDFLEEVKESLYLPKFQPYLGRKSCVPSRNFIEGWSDSDSVREALSQWPWRSRRGEEYKGGLWSEIEGEGDIVMRDVTLATAPYLTHGFRTVGRPKLSPPVQYPPEKVKYPIRKETAHTKKMKHDRMVMANGRCELCGDFATDGHHITYERYGEELLDDLRVVCELHHEACTRIEYAHLMGAIRTVPDPFSCWAEAIRSMAKIIIKERNS